MNARTQTWPLRALAAALALAPAACGDDAAPPAGNAADGASPAATNRAAAAVAALNGAVVAPALPPCPFQNTSNWAGSIEKGRLNVTGQVDLQMAGFRPTLTERRAVGGDSVAFDLTLSPAAGAPVSDLARYLHASASSYRHAEVYCGGRRIATFDLVIVQ